MIEIRPGTTYPDARQSFQAELQQWETIIAKVTDLFLRMPTQQAEIAATVHYVTQELARQSSRTPAARPDERQVLEEVLRWKQRRHPPLRSEEVAIVIRSLNLLSWLDLKVSADLPLPAELQEAFAEA